MEVLPQPLRLITAPQILQDGDIAAERKELGNFNIASVTFVIGGTTQNGGKRAGQRFAILRGAVEIGRQPHAVAHGNHDVFGNDQAVGFVVDSH